MKTFSNFNEGLTIIVTANSARHAAKRTAAKLAELGLEPEGGFFGDPLSEAWIDYDLTVSDWLVSKGVTIDDSTMLVIEGEGVDGEITSYTL